MNEQSLQHILLPKLEICTELGLYFKNEDESNTCKYIYNNELEFDNNVAVDFGTYFNAFSYGMWRKYTTIDKLYLRLQLQGEFLVQVYQMELVNDMVMRKTLESCQVDSTERTVLDLELSAFDNKGQIGFVLTALKPGAFFYGGEYFTKVDKKVRLPRIAVDICTYHREEYVYRNFLNIKKYISLNTENILERQVDFYIVDNGQSLDVNRKELSNVRIISQPDCGSTGGFTRGIIEIINSKSQVYDRILLMDDDILFEPDIIERICLLTAFLKTEYKDSFIGGGNMDLNIPWMQHELGGFFDEFRYSIYGEYYDLRNSYFLLKNEYNKNATSSAWWFCCVPNSYAKEDNLPYPFFFHKEDMEYSSRSGKPVILLNGIGVWHESFFNKQPSWHAYYDVRNQLILNSLHFSAFNKKKAKKILIRNMVASIIRYRYKECEFLIEAYEDFLKGPEWLRKYDNADYLEEKIEGNYVIQELDEPLDYGLYEQRLNYAEPLWHRIIRKITINGYLMPANKAVIAPISSYNSYIAFRAKRIVNYDFIRQRGFITCRSYKEAIKYISKMVVMFMKIDTEFEKARQMYIKDFPIAIKQETWEKKLNIE